MNKIIETSMKKYFQLRGYKIDIWKKTALASQEFIFSDLLNTAQFTKFGVEHNFSEITNYKNFKKNIDISSYENIEPYISQILKGEDDVLWPGKTSCFSKSSGTTNNISKYIPVTHDALYGNNYQAGRDVYSLFFKNYPESDLFRASGSVFSLGGSFETNKFGIKIGDISALMISELPKWAEEYREPSLDVSLIKEWKDKIPAMIADTKNKNITHLSGVPTWFVSIFEELNNDQPYETLRDIWPNLELFIHGAVSFKPYKAIFEKLMPFADMKYMEVYNASEGFFAIQDDKDLIGEMLLLTNHGIFYEFIAMDQYGDKNAEAISLKGVEIGIDYAMIITTNAGLWRYDIGDTICFTSINPFRIKISGRTKHFINVFGEELMVGNTDDAIAFVSEKTGAIVDHYTAGPVFMNDKGKGGHEWVIEFKEEPKDINQFTRLLDEVLCSLNSDYNAKRQDDIALQELKLNCVPRGVFMMWMEKRGKLGGQHKVPRLSNKRDYIEELLEYILKTA